MSESLTSGGSGKRLRIDKPGSAPQLVLWKHLLPLLRSILRLLGADLQLDGATGLRMNEDGSVAFKISPPVATPTPFMVHSSGKIELGNVGSQMPTLDGDPLDTTTNVIDMTEDSGTFLVWFKISFTPTYYNSYLSSYTLDSVEIETGTTLPTDTASIKYLEFNSVTNGVPSASYWSSSLSITLIDNGANNTALVWNV